MNQSSAKSNLLLASLAPDDYALLQPHLSPMPLKQEAVLQEAQEPIAHVYFPLVGMVSLLTNMKSRESIEIAAIGREGAIGTKVGLRPRLALAKAVVQLPGSALRIEIDKFQEAARQSLAITHLATCADDVIIANLQQAVACNALHLVEARLARWLLHASDCQESDTLPLTQEVLAMILGVRRTTVSLTAQALQRARLIRYGRGNIQLTDRAGLERVSCECYGVVRRNIELIIQTAKLAASPRRR